MVDDSAERTRLQRIAFGRAETPEQQPATRPWLRFHLLESGDRGM